MVATARAICGRRRTTSARVRHPGQPRERRNVSGQGRAGDVGAAVTSGRLWPVTLHADAGVNLSLLGGTQRPRALLDRPAVAEGERIHADSEREFAARP